MRPRFGSLAKNAVLTSGECAMAYATWRHSAAVLPPSTCTVMNLVAPSPSRTMACANRRATPSSACFKAWPSAESSDVTGAFAAWLVAMTMNESLVDVSPSMVTRLNEPSASSSANWCITD